MYASSFGAAGTVYLVILDMVCSDSSNTASIDS